MPWILSCLILLIHVAIAVVCMTTLLISTNLTALIVLVIALALIYVQIVVMSGCTLTPLEAPVGGKKTTEHLRSILGLSEEDMSIGDLEKLLVRLTLLAAIAKLGIVAGMQWMVTNGIAPFVQML